LYPEGGTNTSGGWPPVYYAVVTLFVRVLGVLGMDPLPAARLGSAALWAVGCALLVLVARRYGVPRVPAVTGGLVAAALPVANVLGAFVTPYAAQILVTAALCWLALSLITTPDPSRRLWLTVVLVPALAVLTVPHAVVGVLIATVAVLIANRDWRIRVNHPVVAACTSSAVAAAAYVAWSELSARRTIPFGHGLDAQAQSQLPDPTLGGVTEVLRQWFLFWPNSVAGDALGYDPWQVFVATGATYLAVGAVAAVLLRPNRDRLAPPLALALLVVAPLAAWGSDAYFDFTVPLRYGSSVIGFTCLLLAMAVRSRLAEWTLFVGVSGVLVAGVFSTWP
jgi:hypothetical protein